MLCPQCAEVLFQPNLLVKEPAEFPTFLVFFRCSVMRTSASFFVRLVITLSYHVRDPFSPEQVNSLKPHGLKQKTSPTYALNTHTMRRVSRKVASHSQCTLRTRVAEQLCSVQLAPLFLYSGKLLAQTIVPVLEAWLAAVW